MELFCSLADIQKDRGTNIATFHFHRLTICKPTSSGTLLWISADQNGGDTLISLLSVILQNTCYTVNPVVRDHL